MRWLLPVYVRIPPPAAMWLPSQTLRATHSGAFKEHWVIILTILQHVSLTLFYFKNGVSISANLHSSWSCAQLWWTGFYGSSRSLRAALQSAQWWSSPCGAQLTKCPPKRWYIHMLNTSSQEKCSPYCQEIASMNPNSFSAISGQRQQNWAYRLGGREDITFSPVN